MKIALLSIGSRIAMDRVGVRSLDAYYLRQWLLAKFQDLDPTVDVIGRKIKESKDLDYVVDCDKLLKSGEGLSDYDRVFVFGSTANFFGGQTGPETYKLAQLVLDHDGHVTHVVDDPAIPAIDWASVLTSRKPPCGEEITLNGDHFSATKHDCLYAGRNYREWQMKQNEFQKKLPLSELTGFDGFFGFIIHSQWASQWDNLKPLAPIPRETQISYYGARRGSYRQKRLKYLTSQSRLLVVGYEAPLAAKSIKKVPHGDLPITLRGTPFTLIVGDKEHNGHWDTLRVFEAAYWGLCSLVDGKFDPTEMLYDDSRCYVNGPEETESRMASLLGSKSSYEEMCDFQRWSISNRVNGIMEDLGVA